MAYALYMFRRRSALILRREVVRRPLRARQRGRGRGAAPGTHRAFLVYVWGGWGCSQPLLSAHTPAPPPGMLTPITHPPCPPGSRPLPPAQARYDDQCGPVLLTLLLVTVTLLAFSLSTASLSGWASGGSH